MTVSVPAIDQSQLTDQDRTLKSLISILSDNNNGDIEFFSWGPEYTVHITFLLSWELDNQCQCYPLSTGGPGQDECPKSDYISPQELST